MGRRGSLLHPGVSDLTLSGPPLRRNHGVDRYKANEYWFKLSLGLSIIKGILRVFSQRLRECT